MPSRTGLKPDGQGNRIAYKPRSAHLQPFQGCTITRFHSFHACPTPESLAGSLDVGYTLFPRELRTGASPWYQLPD